MTVSGVLFYELPVALHISDDLFMKYAIEDIIYQRDYYDFNFGTNYSSEQIEVEVKDR